MDYKSFYIRTVGNNTDGCAFFNFSTLSDCTRGKESYLIICIVLRQCFSSVIVMKFSHICPFTYSQLLLHYIHVLISNDIPCPQLLPMFCIYCSVLFSLLTHAHSECEWNSRGLALEFTRVRAIYCK